MGEVARSSIYRGWVSVRLVPSYEVGIPLGEVFLIGILIGGYTTYNLIGGVMTPPTGKCGGYTT